MMAFIYSIYVLVCIFLILVVLLQQGKGADLSVFGGGGTMTAFGARGAATVLHKLTVASFVSYILMTIMIGVLQTREDGSSVVRGLDAAAVTAPAVPGDVDATDDAAATASEDATETVAEGSDAVAEDTAESTTATEDEAAEADNPTEDENSDN
jgi:preprotein translocase subunit SecG